LELGRYTRGKSRVFLDSDNLVNLNHLLATVRDKVDILVILATEEIWWRPWCAAEITVATREKVPIVLVMMPGAGDQPLDIDFEKVRRDVKKRLGPKDMEVLAPFGIRHEDIEHAYAHLGQADRADQTDRVHQVPFTLSSPEATAQAIEDIAHESDLRGLLRPKRFGCLCERRKDLLAAHESASAFINRMFNKKRPKFVIIGDSSNIEAVAAMRICEMALVEICQETGHAIDITCCSSTPETQLLELVRNGARMILMLSQDVLTCRVVQRACLMRAASLCPQGENLAPADMCDKDLAITVFADRLGFQFPTSDFYEDSLKKQLHVTRTASFPGFKAGQDTEFEWSSMNLPYRNHQEATTALMCFYKLLFQQLALSLSTHGSWKTILHQVHGVYERSQKLKLIMEDTMKRQLPTTKTNWTGDSIRTGTTFSGRSMRSPKSLGNTHSNSSLARE